MPKKKSKKPAKKSKTKQRKPKGVGDFLQTLERYARLNRAGEHELGLNPAQWEAVRYLSRANRFSNAPIAASRYLGATKGTISQTFIALERKGYVEKRRRPGERRSIELHLTEAGHEMLAKDPWQGVREAASKLSQNQLDTVSAFFDKLLAAEVSDHNLPSFGTCKSCRYFRDKGAKKKKSGPHNCMMFEEDLTKKEAKKVCAEHDPR